MTLSRIEVDGHPMIVSNFCFNINMHGSNGQPVTLKLHAAENSVEEDIFIPKLGAQQIGALWLIAEGSVVPQKDGCPGWLIVEKLQMPSTNVSNRITSPLEQLGLILYKSRPTTKPRPTRPKAIEKAWYLKKISMENVFNILLTEFMKYHFNDLRWKGRKQIKISEKNLVADSRCFILAWLQKKIDEYENSEEWFVDQGVKPPSGISSKADFEKMFKEN